MRVIYYVKTWLDYAAPLREPNFLLASAGKRREPDKVRVGVHVLLSPPQADYLYRWLAALYEQVFKLILLQQRYICFPNVGGVVAI